MSKTLLFDPNTEEYCGSAVHRGAFCDLAVMSAISVLVFLGFQFRTIPLRVAKETTYLTKPLKQDGKSVDYRRYQKEKYNSELIATESNGLREVLQRFGARGLNIKNRLEFNAVCDRLKISPESIVGDLNFEPVSAFLEKHVRGDNLDIALAKRLAIRLVGPARSREIFGGAELDYYDIKNLFLNRLTLPWTDSDLPMMQKWMKKNGAALDLFQNASKKKVFEIPILGSDKYPDQRSVVFAGSNLFRPFANGLSARANYRIGCGDIDGAIEDIATLNHFARRFQNDASDDVCYGSALAAELISNRAGIAGNMISPPSREQLVDMIRSINRLPRPKNIDKLIMISRFDALIAIRGISQGKRNVFFEWKDAELLVSLGIDWNIVAKQVNSAFDSPDFTMRQRDKRTTSLLDYVILDRRSKQVARYIVSLFQSSAISLVRAKHRTHALPQLKRISLAMLLYEKDHGTLPPAFTVDENDKPLHSWRTLILPYLGEHELYKKIRLNERWDSKHNRQFADIDVAAYRNPDASLYRKGATNYSVVIGPDFAFSGSTPNRLDKFGPNSQSMILVVERYHASGWMDPRTELHVNEVGKGIRLDGDETVSLSGRIGGLHDGATVVGRRDGSAAYLFGTSRLAEMLKGTNRGSTY